MRYYLDTNTLIFVLLKQRDEIENDVAEILEDYSNLFYISSIAARELALLYQERKIKHPKFKSVKDIFVAIDIANYEIKPFTRQHVITYSRLEPAEEHKDPSDHSIIAQSISDKIPIISCDTKFRFYEKQGLELVFNRRR